MTQQILHILNGDAIVDGFKTAFPNQEYLVWREALCQGPLQYKIQDSNFKTQRISFLRASLSANVKAHLIDQLETINLAKYKEVVLWFEYDLFCQVNMMASISWLLQEHDDVKISILNLDDYQEGGFIGLGQIGTSHYANIFKQRIDLSLAQQKYIDALWLKVASKDLELLPFIKASKELHQFNHAMHTIAVFSNENGLGAAWVEARITEALKNNSLAKRELIGKVLKTTAEIGYGDVQIEFVINQLIKKRRLIERESLISLLI